MTPRQRRAWQAAAKAKQEAKELGNYAPSSLPHAAATDRPR